MVRRLQASSHRSAARLCAIVSLTSLFGSGPAKSAGSPDVMLELNKLEPQGKACRVYLVIDNPSETAFEALKLDLFLFRTDGIVDRQLIIDLAPVRATKKSVKVFDLQALACDAIGSILVNEVRDCRDSTGPIADCADRLKLSSRSGPALTK